MLTRKQRWDEFYGEVERLQWRGQPPAFIAGHEGGLFSVQHLVSPPPPQFSWLYRLLKDPPSPREYEAYYDGWPGDRRGWMKFASADEARDFYRYATGRIDFEQYRGLPRRPRGREVRLALDAEGNFAGEMMNA